MPQAVIAIGAWVLGAVGATGLAAAAGTAAFLVGAAVIIGAGVLAAVALTPSIGGGRQADNDKSRQSTVKSTIEPQKVIYGQALVSGPITFVGVSGSDNEVMHHVIALAGHEVDAITDIWLDDQAILENQFNGSGLVTSGTFQNIMTVTKFLGTSDQTADANLVANWFGYTTYHRGRGIAYIHTQFVLNDESQEVWDKYSPNNIKALVRGRRIYDPRLDIYPGGAATNPGSIVFSSNPALAIADYLTNTRFGMKINPDKIDWATVIVSANACDVLVDIPNSLQEKRFTANGVLFATDSHRASIDKLLSAMNGKLIYSSGFYYIKAGIYEAPTEALDEDDLSGAVAIKTSVERSDRFNTVGGIFMDPAELHKTSEFPKVTITSALLRDNNEVLEKEIELPFTNSAFMAQRIANKLVQLSDQQKMVSFPANLAGLRVAVGDRVSVSIEELNWESKVFECLGWSFNDGGNDGVMLTLREDDAGSYADMLPVEYSTVSADGVITDGFPGVPDPQNLTATAGLRSIDLNWINPVNTTKFKEIAIYASPDSSWANKVEIGRTMGTQFFHDASTALDSLAVGDTRYYWVRALQYGVGTGSTAESDRNPDNDTSTISATVGANIADSVEWIDVANFNNLRPDDNATVGATAGSNLTASTGALLGDDDVLNSVVFEDITEVQLAGTGDILQLVGGARVDLQQLGDVASYAYNNGQYLLGITNELDASFGNLQQTVVDITAGTTDVFVSDEPPVAGVGGVPNPIDIYSRWYDSNDNNKPYYWNGTTWVDLSDPRIASNQSEISAVSANLDGTITTVDGHTTQISATASAVSVLDATVVLIDEDLVALTGSYDAFVLAYNTEDADGRIAVNANAIDTLELAVEDIDGLIAVSATDITELKVSRQNYTKLEGTDGEPLTLVDDGPEIELQDTSAVGGATGTAVSILDTRIVETERGISVTSQDIVSLTSALNDTNLNLAGEANAISNLTTIVEIQGDVITATSSDIVTLETTVGENTSSIITQAESINGIEANYSVKVDINDRITGFGFNSTAANAEPDSLFYIIADRFAVVNPASTADAPIVPFAITYDVATSTPKVIMTGNVIIDGDLITTGTVNANRINIDGVTLSRVGDSLVINGEGVGTAQLAGSAVTIDKIADSIQSSDYVTGVSGWKITKAGASEFSNVTVRGSVDAGSINIDGVTLDTDPTTGDLVIKGGGVGTNQIGDTAVTIDKLADSIQSSDYETGVSGWKITKAGASEFSNVVVRGSVDAGSINIDGVTLDTDPTTGNLIVKGGGIGTGQLATGAVTADQLAPDAVTADKVDPNAIIFSQGDVVVIYNWDGTNHSPSASYIEVPVIFTNVAGTSIAGVTKVRITWVSATELTGAEFETNADTVVSVEAGGGTSDAYVRMKVVHTASGVSTYVTGTILASGGSGGK